MLILTILGLALIDSINPTPIAVAILILLYRGAWGVWAYIYGIFLATLAQSFVLYFGLSKLLDIISGNNLLNSGWVLIVIGGGLSIYGLSRWQQRYEVPNRKKWTPLSSFSYTNHIKCMVLGIAMTLAETPGAFLLIFAVIEVKKIGMNAIFLLLYFALYAVIYTLPIIILNVAAIWQKKRLEIWLNRRLKSLYIRLNIGINLSLIALGIFLFVIGVRQLI